MEYQVKDLRTNEVISTHATEAKAIESAKTLGDAFVVAHEVSGSYESNTMVWPQRGATYSN